MPDHYSYSPTPEQDERLLKLIAFLDTLAPEAFDFSLEVADSHEGCGTICCAIGWTPVVFPKLVSWVFKRAENGDIFKEFKLTVEKYNSGGYATVAEYLFGIDYYTAGNLFFPGSQYWVDERLTDLPYSATPQAVAAMLREFRELCKA